MKSKRYNEKKRLNMFWHGTALHGGAPTNSWIPTNRASAAALLLFFFFSFLLASTFAGWIHPSMFIGVSDKQITRGPTMEESQQYSLKCNPQDENMYYPTKHKATNPSSSCPSYFRWIHQDLRPWKETGITREMLEKARRTAHFRLVIVDGKAYIESYRKSIQTRDMFTLWGILQLLRWYPGRLPDLELMFDCDDRPLVRSKTDDPPPLFRYCGDDSTLDIVFPDWSFWGWAETNIRPWRNMLEDIKQGNKRRVWEERVPYAYWKGNPNVSPIRKDLLKCNASHIPHSNTLLYIQDWDKETKQGYKQSKLEDQCTHRYKIYVEGWAWSVSEKYILACDSMTLLIHPRYYDFFVRGMVPLQHYWPIRDTSKCSSLRFAVEWGNNNTYKAKGIGEAAAKFIQEDLGMDNVYDYMFHLLSEYAKLLKFKPIIPQGAKEVSSETMACPENGIRRSFMEESLVKSPRNTDPCSMPLPYDQASLEAFLLTKANSTRQVEMWEDHYWLNKKQ